MKVLLDSYANKNDLKDYLLSQDGIKSVCLKDDYYINLSIEYDETINSIIVMKYIDMFINYKFYHTIKFDKETKGSFNKLEYVVDDMCCEYCYMNFVHEAFLNEHIKSLDSNVDFRSSLFNVKLIIEYDNNFSKDELIKFINDNK